MKYLAIGEDLRGDEPTLIAWCETKELAEKELVAMAKLHQADYRFTIAECLWTIGN